MEKETGGEKRGTLKAESPAGTGYSIREAAVEDGCGRGGGIHVCI
jgi:hypothetical protein